MQSGQRNTARWLLEYDRPTPATPEPLMGWNSMQSTLPQIRLAFPTQQAAIAYANAHGIPYTLQGPHAKKVPPKAYAENFSFARRSAFDHKVSE